MEDFDVVVLEATAVDSGAPQPSTSTSSEEPGQTRRSGRAPVGLCSMPGCTQRRGHVSECGPIALIGVQRRRALQAALVDRGLVAGTHTDDSGPKTSAFQLLDELDSPSSAAEHQQEVAEGVDQPLAPAHGADAPLDRAARIAAVVRAAALAAPASPDAPLPARKRARTASAAPVPDVQVGRAQKKLRNGPDDASAGAAWDARVPSSDTSSADNATSGVGAFAVSRSATEVAAAVGRQPKTSRSDGEPRKGAKKDTHGHGLCTHGNRRSRCKECGGGSICEHGRDRWRCVACGGGGVCTHGRRRDRCAECGGTDLCKHGRQRHTCKDCGGSSVCPHGRTRGRCKECGGRELCEHGRRRFECAMCGGAGICAHGKRRHRCRMCRGSHKQGGNDANA